MRRCRLFLVVLAALMAAGCWRHNGQIQYAYFQPAAQAGYAAPAPAAYPPQAYAQPQSYAPPAASGAAASAQPQPRGLFSQNRSFSSAPVYAPPAYQPPQAAYAAACGSQCPSSYQAPAVQSYGYQAAAYPSYAAYNPQGGFDDGYQLDAGDRLRITVFGQDNLTNSYMVDAAGYVTMPLVGAVPARGFTTAQLAQAVSERLRQGYIREPQVAIEIEAYRPFFIYGEVTAPGQYPYVANMTVENAIAVAGGFGPRADKRKVTLSRTVAGQTTQAGVALNYPLRPGDTLRIGERWF